MDSLVGSMGGRDAPPPSNGIAAVAARIQERAFQLSSERAALEETLAELEEAKKVLSDETGKNASVRREMLAAVRSRHGTELELLRREEEAEVVRRETAEIEEETRKTREEALCHKKKWESIASDVYARHDVETELYRRRVESRIRRREERRRRRERRLDALALKAEMFREEASSMQLERDRIREEIQEMDEREEREDEEIAALAMQIRATLNKRASLRAAVQEAREQHKKANETMLRWENECSRLANAS